MPLITPRRVGTSGSLNWRPSKSLMFKGVFLKFDFWMAAASSPMKRCLPCIETMQAFCGRATREQQQQTYEVPISLL